MIGQYAVTPQGTVGLDNVSAQTAQAIKDMMSSEGPAEPRKRERGPNVKLSRQRLELLAQIERELATLFAEIKHYTTVDRLKTRYPDFRVWTILSEREQKELTTTEFKPKAYARTLVLRNYGLTSPEALKKDRAKLRLAAK